MAGGLEIRLDNLRGPEIEWLLNRHLSHMYSITPAESVHALDLEGLRVPGITFWSGRLDGSIAGCIALKDHGGGLGEIKSMHTIAELRGRGIARALVSHLVGEAKARGLKRLSLETGRTHHFDPAQSLYRSFGFTETGPFAGYGPDPHSFFMTRAL